MTANLLSRLEGLTAPDREVDEAIHVLVSGVTAEWQEYRQANAYHRDGFWVSIGEIPAYTASLDAAVALCERVLPGYDWTVDKSGGRGFAGVGQSFNEEAATPAIALLIAILTALEARDAG